MKTNTKYIASMLTVLMLLITAMGALAVASADNESEETVTLSEYLLDNDLILTNEQYLAVERAAANEIDNFDPMTIQPMVFPILAIIVVGVVVGLAANWIENKFFGDGEQPGAPIADETNTKAALRQLRAELNESNWRNVTQIFAKLINNDASIIPFTEAYFNLQAETAMSDLWSATGTFVEDRVLTRSTFISNYSTYKYNVQSAINQFALSMSNERIDVFNNPEKSGTYGTMRVGWSWGSETWIDTQGTSWMAVTDVVSPTETQYRVYIDVINYAERLSNTNYLYVFTGNGKITNATTGQSYNVSQGANDLLALGVAPGWYDLQPGAMYAGNLMSSSSLNDDGTRKGLQPASALVMQSNGTYALAYDNGANYTIIRGSQSWTANDVSFLVSHLDAGGSNIVWTVPIHPVMTSYGAVISAINHASDEAVKSAKAVWLIYDALGTSSSLIKPSSLIAGMQNNTEITAEQQAALYAAAMKQLVIYGEQIRPEDIKVSRESLDLVVHGDIYYRGTLIAENAVYTPFMYLDDYVLARGSHDVTSPGIAMIWATNIASLEDWNGQMVQYEIIEIGEGFQLRTNDIIHQGKVVDSLTLTMNSVEYLGLMDFGISSDAPILSFIDFSDEINMLKTVIVILTAILAILIIRRVVPPIYMFQTAIIIVAICAIWWLLWTGTLQSWIDQLLDAIPFLRVR